jgi:hypothetical protein
VNAGTQLTAPEGFGPLERGMIYCFLRSDPLRKRVALVHFSTRPKPHATLVVLPRHSFEQALLEAVIVPCEKQARLPPWLMAQEGLNFEVLDLSRPKAVKTYHARVHERLQAIWPLVERADQLLTAEDPALEISRYARQCQPPQHETRLRVWFLSYLCFGRNVWALLPTFHRIGQWDRKQRTADQKLGRPSLARGRRQGFNSADLADDICRSYLRYCQEGRYMTQIYVMAIRKAFGCDVKTCDGRKIFVQPDGKPFPSYDQFRYRVIQRFGVRQVQQTLYGGARYRTRIAASLGSYTDSVSNLLEQVELDGYFVEEVPRGLLEGTHLPPLCVVRIRCVVSGMIVGIGFSFGSERRAAYRMALFSMVVPKVRYCSFLGITIRHDEWPSCGLSPACVTDRGPGAEAALLQRLAEAIPVREIVPSYSGQSKATIESSNPRTMRAEGRPSYQVSFLNPIEMVRREIFRVLKDNHSMDANNRLTPEMVQAGVTPYPLSIWQYLDARARTNAQPLDFGDAVREFLTPIRLSARDDGLWFHGQRYDSAALRETGILSKVAVSQTMQIHGYLLDLCVRQLWVEIEGRLIQVDAVLQIRDDDGQLYMSLPELEQIAEERRALQSELRLHRPAVAAEYAQRFEEETGCNWDSAQRRAGRPKRGTRAAVQEARDVAGMTEKGNRL